MNTDQLIRNLAHDHRRQGLNPERMWSLILPLAVVAAAAMFTAVLGPRSDFLAAIQTPRFVFKFVLMGALLVAAMAAVMEFRTTGWAGAVAGFRAGADLGRWCNCGRTACSSKCVLGVSGHRQQLARLPGRHSVAGIGAPLPCDHRLAARCAGAAAAGWGAGWNPGWQHCGVLLCCPLHRRFTAVRDAMVFGRHPDPCDAGCNGRPAVSKMVGGR